MHSPHLHSNIYQVRGIHTKAHLHAYKASTWIQTILCVSFFDPVLLPTTFKGQCINFHYCANKSLYSAFPSRLPLCSAFGHFFFNQKDPTILTFSLRDAETNFSSLFPNFIFRISFEIYLLDASSQHKEKSDNVSVRQIS